MCKICEEGGNVSELYQLWRLASVMKQIDVMVLPADFLDDLIAKEYATGREALLKMFRNLGSGLVSLLKLVAGNLDKLAELEKDFEFVLPIKSFKVSYPENHVAEIDIVGAGKKLESTECSAEFVKAVLTGYGYDITKQELGIGVIRIWASKRVAF